MFSLGSAPHRTIAELEPKYGSVVWLKLGSVNTMAVLTAKAATELFKNHDLSFADRSIVETMKAHGYHNGSLALTPYGSAWRVLRRICTVEMFANKRINETGEIRGRCVENMLTWIEKDGNGNGNGIPVGRFVFLAAFNMLGNLMLSRDLVGPESETGMEFYGAMRRVMEWSGRPNVSDLFPWIRCIDLQGLKRRANRDMGIAFGIASGFVKERIKQRETGGGNEKDFLDVLLEFEGYNGESGKLSETEIIIFILEIFLAGTETTSTTIEWAMTELLRNPSTMAKAKDEISNIVVNTEKFQENHIDNLPYLQAVMKETLRLHPPIPFLIPRRAVRDTNFMGYFVPKNTQVFVNVWAIGRDQECWYDASCFKPDRFLGTNADYRGQHFELIPFGAGRRMCVGLTLGHRMLHFVLGSLLREFDWELESSVGPEDVDMKERMGITVGKLVPLKAVPRKCVS
ncbi:hypothetical protein DH2020_018032 [Rehmannia glutinosa]|uniref:Uncharacterized protein n=1 Tax=Rehmannia glutinosa TaxID=99300 RepID=A0ABR0WMA7_REHGL